MTFKELLAQQGFTQDRLAQHLHVSQVAVSKWVRNVATPTRENVLKIAQVLNVDANFVIQCFYR